MGSELGSIRGNLYSIRKSASSMLLIEQCCERYYKQYCTDLSLQRFYGFDSIKKLQPVLFTEQKIHIKWKNWKYWKLIFLLTGMCWQLLEESRSYFRWNKEIAISQKMQNNHHHWFPTSSCNVFLGMRWVFVSRDLPKADFHRRQTCALLWAWVRYGDHDSV